MLEIEEYEIKAGDEVLVPFEGKLYNAVVFAVTDDNYFLSSKNKDCPVWCTRDTLLEVVNYPEATTELQSSTVGRKDDSGKPDLSLIPYPAVAEMAKGFMLGEKKYGRYNYLKGMDSKRLVAAGIRHALKWEAGEDMDPDSFQMFSEGTSHLGNALCCFAMILHLIETGGLNDTRYKK